jgi:hypothetical protein
VGRLRPSLSTNLLLALDDHRVCVWFNPFMLRQSWTTLRLSRMFPDNFYFIGSRGVPCPVIVPDLLVRHSVESFLLDVGHFAQSHQGAGRRAASAGLSLLVVEPSPDHSRRPAPKRQMSFVDSEMAWIRLPFLAIPRGSPTGRTHHRPRQSQCLAPTFHCRSDVYACSENGRTILRPGA